MVIPMSRSEVWFQVGVRIFEKFEVLHIAKKLNISVNECVGALIRLWSLSITDFPEGKGVLSSGSLSVTIEHLPVIMSLDLDGEEIYQALKDCSWIDLKDGVVVIPEWSKKTGQTILKLERDRNYKRKGEV
jgi:hypothetical protein